MSEDIRTFRWFTFIFLMCILLSILAIFDSFGAADNPGIVPPDSKPGGFTYGEWGVKWWQWAFSMPINANPLFDTAPGSTGQSGDVWFLGSAINTEQKPSGEVVSKADRKLTVPIGTMLFFPVMNVEGSKAEGNGETELELKNYDSGFVGNITDMFAEIDGVPVKDLQQYRAQSSLYTVGSLPDNNVLQFLKVDAPVGTTTPSVADGFCLMLEPLSIGTHTIHFGGTAKFISDPNEPGFKFFKQEATYQITVKQM
jgi:hypothetical protein